MKRKKGNASIQEINPAQAALEKEIRSAAQEVARLADLDGTPDFAPTVDALIRQKWWEMTEKKNYDHNDWVLFFYLISAGRYLEKSWEYLKNENLADAQRYLEAAKDHLEMAKKTAKKSSE